MRLSCLYGSKQSIAYEHIRCEQARQGSIESPYPPDITRYRVLWINLHARKHKELTKIYITQISHN